ncbi:MAG: response regulator [Chloroflexi bacterium]|nr:response regulator [Chloroflexota bacterium]
MSEPQTAKLAESVADISSMLRQLQEETIVFAPPALCVGGFALIAVAQSFRDPLSSALSGLLLILLAVAAWALGRIDYVASAWTLVIGVSAVILLLVTWGEAHSAILLLAAPGALAALFIGIAGGASTAAVLTLLLIFAPFPSFASLPPGDGWRIGVAMQAWITLGLVWLASRPLLTATQWSWSSYERARRLLDEARDSRLELKQALEDLSRANVQLTRLNRLAQALRQAAEDARRVKEEFVANVSHELRTPLNMIIGFSEMIAKAPQSYAGNLPPALLADISVILRNSQHLANLIDDVLDLSQIEAGRMALTKERVALAEIVEAATIAVRPLFGPKGLYLETEVGDDLPLVLCDRTRIREVLLNLLSNAGRYTKHGGVRVRAWREGHEVVVSVADTGPGIAPEHKERLFRPFEQLDGSIRRVHHGSGLGLSISKAFVDLHGGKMGMESEVGRGTTFFFRLPIDEPAAMDGGMPRWFNPHWPYEEHHRRPTAPQPVVRPRYVVLERNGSLYRLLRRYADNVETVPVQTLEEAIAELSRVPAQAILVNEPSVADVIRQLGQSGALPHGVPAIICAVPGMYEAAGDLGITDYLVKPVSRDQLLAALERLNLRGKTVLIVDDEPGALRLFHRMLALSERRYRVLRASDGEQALSILRQRHPDVILLDLVMPNMDGFRLLEVRNADPALREIPVVVVSARDPAGQPIVSNSLGLTRGGGLSIPQLLACVQALSRVVGAPGQDGDPAPTGMSPG